MARVVYHLPTDGDPMFVAEPDKKEGSQIYVARAGVHNHFPIWSPDAAFIYFVQGKVLDNNFYESDVWRIRPTSGEPERITFHNTRVTFPTLLNNRTLLYLATDDDGFGPWIYAMDLERRVPRRISTGVEPYTSLAASVDGRRLVATLSRSTTSLWRVPIGNREVDESVPLQFSSRPQADYRREGGMGTSSIVRRTRERMVSGNSRTKEQPHRCGMASRVALSQERPLNPAVNASRFWCKKGDRRNCTW